LLQNSIFSQKKRRRFGNPKRWRQRQMQFFLEQKTQQTANALSKIGIEAKKAAKSGKT
jgi:hypothetical protein